MYIVIALQSQSMSFCNTMNSIDIINNAQNLIYHLLFTCHDKSDNYDLNVSTKNISEKSSYCFYLRINIYKS